MLLKTISNPVPAMTDRFGFSVAISDNAAVVGAPYDDAGGLDMGTAYVFNAATGGLTTPLNNPDPISRPWFGWSAAISGKFAVVGVRTESYGPFCSFGTAYIFDVTTGELAHMIDDPGRAPCGRFGSSVAISGDIAVVGAPGYSYGGDGQVGAAYVFNSSTGALLSTLNNPTPQTDDEFATSVAVSGNFVFVGCLDDLAGRHRAGTVYGFDATTGALVLTLHNPSPVASRFGTSVAISGNLVVVGAPNPFIDSGTPYSGTAYVFDATMGALTATLNNPGPALGDNFGASVAISGNVAVIGAPYDDTGATDAGTAYVFNATTGGLAGTLNNPAPATNDYFGSSVGISGNLAVVGSYQDDAGAADAGTAYVFNIASPVGLPAPQDIIPALLGATSLSSDLEANCDGNLDIADLLRMLIPNPQ